VNDLSLLAAEAGRALTKTNLPIGALNNYYGDAVAHPIAISNNESTIDSLNISIATRGLKAPGDEDSIQPL
jgi:hypothetical protein